MFASALMDMSFYQTDVYIVDIQNKYLESALDEITELLRQKKAYCPKIRTIIEKALAQSVDRCCGKQGWAVVIAGGSQEQYVVTEVVSPRVTRMHTVTVDRSSAIKVVSCLCHEFTRMEVTCPGIVAVLKSQGEDPYDAQWLTEHWRLSYHPLWYKAMQRLAPMTSFNDLNDEGSQALQEPEAQQAIVSRYTKISMIPVPTHANLRRAQMNDAFFSLRDDFDVPDSPEKYRQVMAAIFDLRSCFKGSPGQWVQDPLPLNGTITTQSWNGDQRAKPPINQANFTKRPAGKSQCDMSVREYRKKQKAGDFPTVAQRREQQGDWTLYWPSNRAPTFMCPLPGCMKKPIKNSDQGKYHHRCSQQHQRLLKEHPLPPASGLPGLSAAEQVAFPEPSGGDTDAPDSGAAAAAGIPGDDSFKHVPAITDSMVEEVEAKFPTYPNMPKTAYVQRAVAFMDAAQQRKAAGASRGSSAAGAAAASGDDDEGSVHDDDEADDSDLASLQTQCNHQCLDYDETTSKEEMRAKVLHRATFYAGLRQISNSDETGCPEGLFTVECGLNGDCFFHCIAWHLSVSKAGNEIPNFIERGQLASLHVPMRVHIMDHLSYVADTCKLNPEMFGEGYPDQQDYSLSAYVQMFEHCTVEAYVERHKKQHQHAGVPEFIAWTSSFQRPLVVLNLHPAEVYTYVPYREHSVHAVFGWEHAGYYMENGAFCILHTEAHFLAVVPYHRLAKVCPQRGTTGWADYCSRPINNAGRHVEKIMPLVRLHHRGRPRPCNGIKIKAETESFQNKEGGFVQLE